MNKEYKGIDNENFDVLEFHQPCEHADSSMEEYFKRCEYWTRKNEYADDIKATSVTDEEKAVLKGKERSRKRHKKLIKKMVYAVSSAVMVITISQTINETPNTSSAWNEGAVSEREDNLVISEVETPNTSSTWNEGAVSEQEENLVISEAEGQNNDEEARAYLISLCTTDRLVNDILADFWSNSESNNWPGIGREYALDIISQGTELSRDEVEYEVLIYESVGERFREERFLDATEREWLTYYANYREEAQERYQINFFEEWYARHME